MDIQGMSMSLDTRTLCKMVVKYITLGLVAAATFAILDLFAPTLSGPAQLGAGVGLGLNLVHG